MVFQHVRSSTRCLCASSLKLYWTSIQQSTSTQVQGLKRIRKGKATCFADSETSKPGKLQRKYRHPTLSMNGDMEKYGAMFWYQHQTCQAVTGCLWSISTAGSISLLHSPDVPLISKGKALPCAGGGSWGKRCSGATATVQLQEWWGRGRKCSLAE